MGLDLEFGIWSLDFSFFFFFDFGVWIFFLSLDFFFGIRLRIRNF